jgi:hypothetical protein
MPIKSAPLEHGEALFDSERLQIIAASAPESSS